MLSEEEKLELEFLRFFYDKAADSMGPADWDIYHMIKQDFKRKHGKLPKAYNEEEETDQT